MWVLRWLWIVFTSDNFFEIFPNSTTSFYVKNWWKLGKYNFKMILPVWVFHGWELQTFKVWKKYMYWSWENCLKHFSHTGTLHGKRYKIECCVQVTIKLIVWRHACFPIYRLLQHGKNSNDISKKFLLCYFYSVLQIFCRR